MKQYGLIGFPLGHSFSKKYFTEKFEREGIDAQYNLFELKTIEEFKSLIQNSHFSGLNVTIPYKEQVISFLDELDETATEIGAVNTIRFISNADKTILKGYNSDVVGFTNSIKPLLLPTHKKALILGTGGASKAIAYGLKKMGLETKFVSRTVKPDSFTYWQLNKQILSDYLIIVNASPVGTYPHSNECPDIPYQYLSANHLLFDAVYNPSETLFMKKGREQGALVINGEAMLVGQAIEAWKIWNL